MFDFKNQSYLELLKAFLIITILILLGLKFLIDKKIDLNYICIILFKLLMIILEKPRGYTINEFIENYKKIIT